MIWICLLLTLGCEVVHEKVLLPPTFPWAEDDTVVETFHGVPVDILDRLIQSESSWSVHAENRTRWEHSVGLAQVNLRWLPYFRERYGLEDPRKPSEAITFAARYLYDLSKETGSWYEAVLAYKCGLVGRRTAPQHIRWICLWVVYGNDP